MSSSRPPRSRSKIALAVGAGVVLLLAAVFVVDLTTQGDHVRRNVDLAGRSVGGYSEPDLRATVEAIAADHATAAVAIDAPTGTAVTTAGTLGLTVDVDATVAATMAIGRSPINQWFTTETARIVFRTDLDTLTAGTADLAADNQAEPIEPTLTITNGSVTVVPGTPGSVLDVPALAAELTRAADAAQLGPVTVVASVPSLPPAHTDADAQRVAAEANSLTDEPLTVTVADTGTSATVTPDMMRSWVEMVEVDDVLVLELDETTVAEDVTALIGDIGAPVQQLTWGINGFGVPTFTEGTPGTRCCGDDTGALVIAALADDEPTVELGLVVVQPDHDAAWAEGLGITQPIASFTTNHPAGQNRVHNIQTMADTVRGTVIAPGQTFSLNDTVGKRTTAKGYLEDGVIYNGKLTKDVGGGVSQFATTAFNAAFFGGLDIPEYQMHTIYISRYPYGREATLSFPNPDLKLTNNTPYGVLIWTSYTPTSITVSLYSTPWVTGEQTNQTTSPAGACTRVVTERTRTWLDGRTGTDTFSVRYQPGDGLTC